MAQAVECLPRKQAALNSSPRTARSKAFGNTFNKNKQNKEGLALPSLLHTTPPEPELWTYCTV
jgi:hypothetical protein